MKFKTTHAPRMVTTGKAREMIIRSDHEIAALVAKYKPAAIAHAKAKATAKVAATETNALLANARALTSKVSDQFAKKGD